MSDVRDYTVVNTFYYSQQHYPQITNNFHNEKYKTYQLRRQFNGT